MPRNMTAAALYEQLHRGNPGDVEFYARACRGAETVLELGSGYGRISFALADAGLRVSGLENDSDLLARAEARLADLRRRDLEFIRGDMRSFDLLSFTQRRRFERILVPYNGLYCLEGAGGVRDCFTAAARHAGPGTELWFDVYPVDEFHREAALDVPDDDEPVAVLDIDGESCAVLERSTWDRSAQRLDVTYEVRSPNRDVVATQAIRHDYLLSNQFLNLLEECGWEPVMCLGHFDGREFDDDADHFIVGAAWPATSRS